MPPLSGSSFSFRSTPKTDAVLRPHIPSLCLSLTSTIKSSAIKSYAPISFMCAMT